MKEVGLYEAKTKLSALVAEVEASGESIVLTRHGKAVAQIAPAVEKKVLKRGFAKTPNFYIADDFDTCDVGFDEFFEKMDKEIEEVNSARVAEGEPTYNNKKI